MSDQIVNLPPLGQLGFLYQPIVALERHELSWSEALVRWRLPDGTVRGPKDVLPHWLAEHRQEAFIRFSVEKVAAALSTQSDAHVSLNLSPAQVVHPQTLSSLEGLLPDVRARLRVELTEQTYGDTKRLWSSLADLRSMCGAVLLDDITLDDAHDRLPADDGVDGVKLDRSVTVSLADKRLRPRVERFVRDLTARFAIVVVEGVEDPAVCDGLGELGVSHVQGFGIALPRSDLIPSLVEPRLPDVEAAVAKGLRLTLGSLLLGDGESNPHI